LANALLVDFYELTMAHGYFASGRGQETAYFDLFFRSVPDDGGYVVVAGLEQAIDYLRNLSFDEAELAYLKRRNLFSEAFLEHLRTFRFTGSVWAIPEGTIVFPNEPLLTVRANLIEAQLIETALLLFINHQSLIATKTQRIVRAAEGKNVFEFGTRRAHGTDASVLGARAAYIGGAVGSSNALADLLHHVPAVGTMAHSWVQLFDTEYEAFATYCALYPHTTTLLVDTYSVLKSGVPNAIRAIRDVLHPRGIRKANIRIDSGDLCYLSNQARKMLDEAGLTEVGILASNSLDEEKIADLIRQGASIDGYGVGERLITAASDPVFGGVYKLVAIEKNGSIVPKIKISENPDKIPTPSKKRLYRLYDESGKAIADYLTDHDETLVARKAVELFDPSFTWKRKTVVPANVRELQVPVFENGKLVYESPSIEAIRTHRQKDLSTMWPEVLRLQNPHKYYVDLSTKVWTVKNDLIRSMAELVPGDGE
jgi:nicotinate phosphoribosyltransferase